MRCHTSDHYLATSVPRGGRSSMFPCQVIIVLVLSRVRPIQIPPSLSLIVCSQHRVVTCLKDFSTQRYWVTTHSSLHTIRFITIAIIANSLAFGGVFPL